MFIVLVQLTDEPVRLSEIRISAIEGSNGARAPFGFGANMPVRKKSIYPSSTWESSIVNESVVQSPVRLLNVQPTPLLMSSGSAVTKSKGIVVKSPDPPTMVKAPGPKVNWPSPGSKPVMAQGVNIVLEARSGPFIVAHWALREVDPSIGSP